MIGVSGMRIRLSCRNDPGANIAHAAELLRLGRCSDFGASDHGPVSFRRVGKSVDLPVKARRGGHDLRGSRQSGWLKSRSRQPQPRGNGHGSEVARGEPPPRSGLFGKTKRRWPVVRQSPVPHGAVLCETGIVPSSDGF